MMQITRTGCKKFKTYCSECGPEILLVLKTKFRTKPSARVHFVLCGEYKAKLIDSANGVFMFTDLFHLIRSLEHDYREENGKQVHDCGCRRCALTVRLNHFKIQMVKLLRDIEFAIGEPTEKNKQP